MKLWLCLVSLLVLSSESQAQQTVNLTWPALSNEYSPSTGSAEYPFKVPDGLGGERTVIVPVNVTYYHEDAAGEQRQHGESVYSDTGEQQVFNFAMCWHEFAVEPQAWSANVAAWAQYRVPAPYPNANELYTWRLREMTQKEVVGTQSAVTFSTTSSDWVRQLQ